PKGRQIRGRLWAGQLSQTCETMVLSGELPGFLPRDGKWRHHIERLHDAPFDFQCNMSINADTAGIQQHFVSTAYSELRRSRHKVYCSFRLCIPVREIRLG